MSSIKDGLEKMTKDNEEKLKRIDDLISMVKEAGRIALDEQKKMTVQTKSDTSIVTNGDLAVSKFLENGLKTLFPDCDVFSEENTGNIPTLNKVIVIDPIDGTESYSRKENTWSILIGFLENGIPVGGVIYQPTGDKLYVGFKGQGAYKVQNDIQVQLKADRSGNLTGIASHSNYGEHEFLNKIGITQFDKMYSAALKIMLVAEGVIDVYPNFRKKCSIWDLIAPQAILEEAGGQLRYEHVDAVDFNSPRVNQNICAVSSRVRSLDISGKK